MSINMEQDIALSLDNIAIAYQRNRVIENLSLQVAKDEIVCLLGESGSGKTTVLKAIAGLLTIDAGCITLGKQEVSSVKTHVLPENRKISMIFQDFALFPHLSVLENVCFGIDGKAQAVKEQGQALLSLVKMSAFEQAYPNELSGGQQQRIAIARALGTEPDILLLDEPFTNVDHHLREQLMLDMRDILKKQGTAAVFVTHSREEAFTFADTMAFMQAGKIVQHDTAENLYFQPATPRLAESLGDGSWLTVTVLDDMTTQSPLLGPIVSTNKIEMAAGATLKQFIRPNQMALVADDRGPGIIKTHIFSGDNRYYLVEMGNELLKVACNSLESWALGQMVSISVTPHQAILFEQSNR